jgi:SAM-dependent methyltransferase
MPRMNAGQLFHHFMGRGDPSHVVDFLQWLVERTVGIAKPRVLDVGAGTGRLLAPLCALGWDVVGLEPRAEYRALDERIRPGGFADIDDVEQFDVVIAVSDPFWYLLTDDARRDALRRVHRALRPGGLLFMEGPSFLWILRNFRPPAPTEKDSIRRTPEIKVDFHAAVFSHYDTFDTDGVIVKDEHHFAMLSWPQLETLLRDAGFDRMETFTGYKSRAPERLDGSRILVSARKA